MSKYPWIDKAREMRASGMKWYEIAEAVGANYDVLRYHLDEKNRDKAKARDERRRKGNKSGHHATTRDQIKALLTKGRSDDEIMREVWGCKRPDGTKWLMRNIDLARNELERETIRWVGPWPVSYVRNTGEVVWRVGYGHDVPDGSLAALGFRLGKDGQR